MKVFSRTDLSQGYHQIVLAPEDVCKIAILTPSGLFEFICMLFGLLNSGQLFQWMDADLSGLPHGLIYIENILVASLNMENHLADLCFLFH